MSRDHLLGRALGALSQDAFASAERSRLLHELQAHPGTKFDGSRRSETAQGSKRHGADDEKEEDQPVWAHKAGVNCITIDRFEGRYMLSGASSSTISLWDLQSAKPFLTSPHSTSSEVIHRPLASTPLGAKNFGITHLSFYPFDSAAFLSSSYDHYLKLYATETLLPSASFDLGSVVYSHAVSQIAEHILVACASQHPAVRLVDLRSGASAQQLAGHHGAVLSVAWSPINEHVLVSGGADGTARVWDIRRSAPCLGVLDHEDAVGVGGEDGFGKNARVRDRGKAHIGACNGVVWSDDGRYLVTAGHDERVRVWDMAVGANALSYFGPVIKNTGLSPLLPLLVPSALGRSGETVMIYPNEKELLVFDLFEGTLLKRLKVPGKRVAQAKGAAAGGGGERNIRHRVTSLAWRAGDVEVYSSHSDGFIRAWKPRTQAEIELDKEEAAGFDDAGDDGRKRKRQALEDVFRDLTKQKITFT